MPGSARTEQICFAARGHAEQCHELSSRLTRHQLSLKTEKTIKKERAFPRSLNKDRADSTSLPDARGRVAALPHKTARLQRWRWQRMHVCTLTVQGSAIGCVTVKATWVHCTQRAVVAIVSLRGHQPFRYRCTVLQMRAKNMRAVLLDHSYIRPYGYYVRGKVAARVVTQLAQHATS
jgi:hypothetical protein